MELLAAQPGWMWMRVLVRSAAARPRLWSNGRSMDDTVVANVFGGMVNKCIYVGVVINEMKLMIVGHSDTVGFTGMEGRVSELDLIKPEGPVTVINNTVSSDTAIRDEGKLMIYLYATPEMESVVVAACGWALRVAMRINMF